MIGGAEGLGVIIKLQAEEVGDFHFLCRTFNVTADVLVQFVESAHNLADIFVGLRDGEGWRKILVSCGRGNELVRGVELSLELARLLFLNGAEGFEQGEGIIGQDDGLGVIRVLFAFDPA